MSSCVFFKQNTAYEMRISDWSSDVCSSDLEEIEAQGFEIVAIAGTSMGALIGGIHAAGKLDVYRDWVCALAKFDVLRLLDWTFSGDRKSVVSGKSVSVRVDLGGRRTIQYKHYQSS